MGCKIEERLKNWKRNQCPPSASSLEVLAVYLARRRICLLDTPLPKCQSIIRLRVLYLFCTQVRSHTIFFSGKINGSFKNVMTSTSKKICSKQNLCLKYICNRNLKFANFPFSILISTNGLRRSRCISFSRRRSNKRARKRERHGARLRWAKMRFRTPS